MATFSKIQLDCEEIISKSLFPVLPLIQIPDWEQTKKYYSVNPQHKLNSLILSDNQIISDCRTLCTDILCNTKFDILFSHNEVENYVETHIPLINATHGATKSNFMDYNLNRQTWFKIHLTNTNRDSN